MPKYQNELINLLISGPLYSGINCTNDELGDILNFGIFFDIYCPSCDKYSTFKYYSEYHGLKTLDRKPNPKVVNGNDSFILTFRCQRVSIHTIDYTLKRKKDAYLKVGQYPSLEDLNNYDVEQFRKTMNPVYYGELKRGCGLASHGIGVGSYVYIRRVLEKILNDYRAEFELRNGAIEGFYKMRMDEKIKALEDILPKAMVKNKSIYGILSKGIHELSEEECRAYFPLMKAVIIQILQQEKQIQEQKEAEALLEKEVAKAASILNK